MARHTVPPLVGHGGEAPPHAVQQPPQRQGSRLGRHQLDGQRHVAQLGAEGLHLRAIALAIPSGPLRPLGEKARRIVGIQLPHPLRPSSPHRHPAGEERRAGRGQRTHEVQHLGVVPHRLEVVQHDERRLARQVLVQKLRPVLLRPAEPLA